MFIRSTRATAAYSSSQFLQKVMTGLKHPDIVQPEKLTSEMLVKMENYLYDLGERLCYLGNPLAVVQYSTITFFLDLSGGRHDVKENL